MSVVQGIKGDAAQQAKSLVGLFLEPQPVSRVTGDQMGCLFVNLTDRTTVPPVITARRAVRCIQLSRVC
jgi:hypothetical protein